MRVDDGVLRHEQVRQPLLTEFRADDAGFALTFAPFDFARRHLRAGIAQVSAAIRAGQFDHAFAGAADGAYFRSERRTTALGRALVADRTYGHSRQGTVARRRLTRYRVQLQPARLAFAALQ